MQSFVVLILLFIVIDARFYNNKYFDEKNFTYAECVPAKKFYAYFGSKNVALDGRKCIEWSVVREELELQMKGYYQYYFPTEFENHDQCRTILLDRYERDPRVNNASAHSFIDFDEWQKGPWCYVKNLYNETSVQIWFGKFNSSYRPWPCFEVCEKRGQTIATTLKPMVKSSTKYYYHYNEDLIEHLADEFFIN